MLQLLASEAEGITNVVSLYLSVLYKYIMNVLFLFMEFCFVATDE